MWHACEIRRVFRNFVRKSEKKYLEKPWHAWESIKMDVEEIWGESFD
jgi:hypothetical protein